MNKKGKQKNRQSKPQNPTPPPTDDKPNDEPNNEPNKIVIEQITELETKPAETIQDILSDMVVIEADDDDFECPKKPKRNRAKKKNLPQEVAEDTKPVTEVAKEDEITNEALKKSDESDKATVETTAPVEPAGRKKKGKKGAQESSSTKDQEKPEAKDHPFVADSTISKTIVETLATEIQEQESKAKKKNKKGKKRTDSERSDKAEETLICTAAFQKIMQPRTEADSKKECKKNETPAVEAKPDIKTTQNEPEKSKKDSKTVSVEIKSDKRDEKVKPNVPSIQSDVANLRATTKKCDKKGHASKNSSKETLDHNEENIQCQLISEKSSNAAKEPIYIPEKPETVINKECFLLEQTPQKPKKEKHKGKKDNKEASEILIREPESVISEEKLLNTVQPKFNILDETKIVLDVPTMVEKEPSKEEILSSTKENKKDKKTKITPEVKTPQMEHEDKMIEPVKLADILSLFDPNTIQKIENQQKQLITENPVIPKEIPLIQPTKESQQTPLVETKTATLESGPAQSIETKLEDIVKLDIQFEKEKSTGAKPKAKIIKPVEKSKGNSKIDSSIESEGVTEAFSSDSTVKTFEKGKVKPNDNEEVIKIENLKKEIIVDLQKSEAVSSKTETTEIKKTDNPLKLEENIQMNQFKIAEKPASNVLLEMIEKPLQKVREATPIQSDVTNLQCPQEKSRKKKKSPKPETKPKDISVAASKLEIKDAPKGESVSESENKKQRDSTQQHKQKKFKADPVTFEHLTDTDEELATLDKKIITPDQIEYPRSASVQYTDGNNNTLIQEIGEPLMISIIDEVPLLEEPNKVPVDVPKPATEENIIIEAALVKVEEKAEAEPKQTDLKTKVLEVNKDMEDLRLSIERSLAELSALEKCEEEIFKPDIPNIVSDEKKNPKTDSTNNQPSSGLLQADVKITASTITSPITSPTSIPESTEIKTAVTKGLDVPVMTSDNSIEISIVEQMLEPPAPPQRKENKGKNKSKKKGKQESGSQTAGQAPASSFSVAESQKPESTQKDDKKESKSDSDTKNQEKRQTDATENAKDSKSTKPSDNTGVPIENFEDALTTSIVDVNKAFEVISGEVDQQNSDDLQRKLTETDSAEPDESKKAKDERKAKENPVSQPKNFLGHPYNPVPSNRIDYKKEKNKPPNETAAEINVKDSVEIEPKQTKASKESQTFGKERIKNGKTNETITVTNENEEYIYKYSFRNVYLSNACHFCKKDLRNCRIECSFCHLIFYCSQNHKEEDYVQHQSLCFAVSTLSHIKGTKHIYADAQNITGYNYRLLRMQTIVACEKILKRNLLPWEQEALLYPRMCADPTCREWRNENLKDCSGCGQLSFCSSNPGHLPTIHQRWCASYSLYHKLVVHQLTEGRLEPRLPTKLLNCHNITDNINRLFADMYEEKIDMTDIEYASLTQLATAPLTAAYGYQLFRNKMAQAFPRQDFKKASFTIHVIGAELQFEADSLNKWEKFFLHIKPELQTLNVVLIGPELNPANLPTHLLGKIKMCPNCRVDKRRVEFNFQDNKYYHEYCDSEDFLEPDLICAFNPSIQRSSSYTKNDQWIATLNCIIKQKVPFLVTSYTMTEMQRDMNAVKILVRQKVNVISEAKFNPFASVRPDRNFISDDEMPLLFKNYCYMVLIGAL